MVFERIRSAISPRPKNLETLKRMINSCSREQMVTGSTAFIPPGKSEQWLAVSKEAMALCTSPEDLYRLVYYLNYPQQKHQVKYGNFGSVMPATFRLSCGDQIEVAVKRFKDTPEMDLTGLEQFLMLDLLRRDGYAAVVPYAATTHRMIMSWYDNALPAYDDPDFTSFKSGLFWKLKEYQNEGLLRSRLAPDPYPSNYPLNTNPSTELDKFIVRDPLCTWDVLEDPHR